jgi:hypothetical protein
VVYAVIGLVVVLLGVGVGAAVWIGKLKDASAQLAKQLTDSQVVHITTLTNLRAEQARRVALEEQVNVLSKAYQEIERLATSGILDTPAGIVAELRKLFGA